eukprot:5350058-Amphidinium_carterae.1
MKEEVILVQETFLPVGSVAKASYEAKACEYHSFFVPAHKPQRGRPQGGLAVLSRVAVPAVVPHSGLLKGKVDARDRSPGGGRSHLTHF